MTENEMNNQAAQTMPEPVTASMCPSSDYAKGWNDCLAALSQTAGVPEPNGKLVGWWNGIKPDVTERSPYGPSVRWGADAEDRAHDIPLYDGYNPVHFTKPTLPGVDAFASAIWCDWMTNEQANKLGAELHAWLRAHIAAAPAASGGESAASVSERARIDTLALDVALRFTQETEPQRRASLQVAVIAAIEQALTQQRVEVLDRPARVGGRDFKAGELVQRVVGRAHAEYDRHHDGCLRHPYTGELRDYRDVESDPDGTLCVGPGPLAATTPQPSADAVLVPKGAAETARTVAEEWLAMFSDIPGLEKYERYTYGPAVEQLRDELESLLSAASGEKGVGK